MLIRIVFLLLAGLLFAPQAPALAQHAGRATDTVAVTSSDSVIEINTGACFTPVRYSVSLGSLPQGGYSHLVATLQRNSDGKNFGSDSRYVENGSTYRGDIYPRCRDLSSGKFTLLVKIDVRDSNDDLVDTAFGETAVRLAVSRPAPTFLVVRKVHYGVAGWQWTGRLTSRGKPVPRARIQLWWDLPGWEDYEVSKTTNSNGVAHWVSNPNGALRGINFRLKFAGTKTLAPSQSAVFNIAPR